MIVTEWEQLVGKTIVMQEQFFLGGRLLVFKDGDYAHVDGNGEEQHGAHWPILREDDLELVKGAVQSMQRRQLMTLLEVANTLEGEALDAWLVALSLEEKKELIVQSYKGIFEFLDELVGSYHPKEVCDGD